MRRMLVFAGLLGTLAAGLGLAGCGTGGESASTTTQATTAPPTTTPTGTTTTEPAATTSLAVYFLRDGKVGAAGREVPETQAVATAALNELIAGTSRAEGAAGLSSALPADLTFHDLTVVGDVASVRFDRDLTREGEAQVVYTLTQFPTVKAVDLGAGPVKRSTFESLTPAILVESPEPGETISSPVRIRGTANTFEATFVVKLDISGRRAFEQGVTATSGTGTRGTFDVSVPFAAGSGGLGTLTAYEASAEDGHPTNVVQIPVLVTGS